MPVFEIYSIGDSAFLAAVLNAIAMIGGSLDTLAKVGFLLGVILMMFSGISMQKIPFQNMVLALVVYMLAFGTTGRVIIEDSLSGAVRTVDNVPLGPAFIGSAMSQVGYGITTLMETAFAVPAMTDHGYGNALQALAKVRQATMSAASMGNANSPTPNADMKESWSNYIADCVMTDVDFARRSMDSITEGVGIDTFATNNTYNTTVLKLGNGVQVLVCDVAFAQLRLYTINNFTPAMVQSVAAELGAEVDAAGAIDAVDEALDFMGILGQDAQTYMLMSAASMWLEAGILKTYNRRHDAALYAGLQQAIDQRNAQWATEQQLFFTYVRPMMTFFEAFIFAIAPFMALAITLGMVGIKMVGRWLQFALWIQLWLPVLAISNLYLLMSTSGHLDALANMQGYPLLSYSGMLGMSKILQQHLSVAGMLAASTPAIALMIIYGSSHTATHLAGRLQGGDHINEKMTSPDLAAVQAPAMISHQKDQTPLGGMATYGSAVALPSYSDQVMRGRMEQASEQAMEQSSTTFMAGLSQTMGRTAQQSERSFDGSMIQEQYAANRNEADAALLSAGEDMSRRFEESGIDSTTFAGGLALAMSLGGGRKGSKGEQESATSKLAGLFLGKMAGPLGMVLSAAKPNLSGDLKTQYEDAKRLADSMAEATMERANHDNTLQASVARGIANSSQDGAETSFTRGASNEDRKTLQRQAQDVVQSTNTHQRVQDLQQRQGVGTNRDARTLSHQLSEDPALMQHALSTIDRLGLTDVHEQVGNMYKSNQSFGFSDERHAEAAAALHVLSGYSKRANDQLDPGQQLDAYGTAFNIIGAINNGPGAVDSDPSRLEHLHGQAGRGDARREVEDGNLYDPSAEARDIRGRAALHWDNAQGQATDEAVTRQYGGYRDDVMNRHGSNVLGMRQKRLERLADSIIEQGGEWNPAKGLAGYARQGVGVVTDVIKQMGMDLTGASGAESYIDQLTDAKADRFSMTPTQQGLYREAAQGSEVSSLQPYIDTMKQTYGEQLGGTMADGIIDAARTGNDGMLKQIGAYNRAANGVIMEWSNPPVGSGPTSFNLAPIPSTMRPNYDRYRDTINSAADEANIPRELAHAVVRAESGYNPSAESHAGAMGLMQLMPATATRFGVSDAFDPEQNVRAGTQYLGWLLDRFDGNLDLALAGYNAGEGAVDKFGGQVPPYRETQNYIQKIKGFLDVA